MVGKTGHQGSHGIIGVYAHIRAHLSITCKTPLFVLVRMRFPQTHALQLPFLLPAAPPQTYHGVRSRLPGFASRMLWRLYLCLRLTCSCFSLPSRLEGQDVLSTGNRRKTALRTAFFAQKRGDIKAGLQRGKTRTTRKRALRHRAEQPRHTSSSSSADKSEQECRRQAASAAIMPYTPLQHQKRG